MDDTEREINQNDHKRAFFMLCALEDKFIKGSNKELWQVLQELYEAHDDQAADEEIEQLTGPEAVIRELHFTQWIALKLLRGETTINENYHNESRNTPCSVPGCQSSAFGGTMCPQHQLGL